MKLLTKTPTSLSPFRLSYLLRLEKDPKAALRLFQNPDPSRHSNRSPFRRSLRSYDLIITKLGAAKMFDEMEEILQQLKKETRFIAKEIIFCNVMDFYARARLPCRARKMFDEIPLFRSQRTVKSLNSLMNALLRCGDFTQLWNVYTESGKILTLDACTYNILIRACCLKGNLETALNLFDEMRKRSVFPNVVTFGTFIYGLCASEKMGEALRLKEDMVRVFGVKPNSHVYASLVKGFCKSGRLDLAFKLKNEMLENEINGDSSVYSSLISALLKVGRKEEVAGLLEEMRRNGCKPDTVTYNAMIDGFCRENYFEAAHVLLEEMVENGCKPDVISYNLIIGGLCRNGRWREANDLFEDMPRRGCDPDVLSYRMLFDGFCEGMKFKEATFILDEMIFKGYAPRLASVNKFLNGLWEIGNKELLWTAFGSLMKGNVADRDTWRIVVSVGCKIDQLSTCELFNSLVMQSCE